MRLLTALAAALFATHATAAPLSFDEALNRAQADAPSLQAAALQAQAARSAAVAAGTLPDPKLKFGVDNFPVSGPNAGRFGADFMTMTTLGVMQDVPNAARRRAERAQAGAEIGGAEAMLAGERREVRVATALAWIDLAFAERKIRTLDALVAGLKGLWEGQPAAVASGGSRPAAGIEPARLRAVFDDRRSGLVAEAAAARAALTRWTGEPEPSAAGEPPRLDLDAAVLRAALEQHPDLRLAGAMERRAEADADAARAAKRPDWGFEVAYSRRDPMFGDMVSAGVTVSLPIFAASRQDPKIAARLADRNRARLEREDRRRELAAALDADLAAHVAHHEKWRRAVEVLVPAAEQRAHLEAASYAAGRAGFDDVRTALTELAETKLDALDREAMVARDGARIQLTYGADQ